TDPTRARHTPLKQPPNRPLIDAGARFHDPWSPARYPHENHGAVLVGVAASRTVTQTAPAPRSRRRDRLLGVGRTLGLSLVSAGDIDLIDVDGAPEATTGFPADGGFDQTPHEGIDPIVGLVDLPARTPGGEPQDDQPGDDNPIGQQEATARKRG